MKKLKTPYAYIINTVVLVALLVLGNMLFAGGALNRATKSVILQCGVYSIMAVSVPEYLHRLPGPAPSGSRGLHGRRGLCGRAVLEGCSGPAHACGHCLRHPYRRAGRRPFRREHRRTGPAAEGRLAGHHHPGLRGDHPHRHHQPAGHHRRYPGPAERAQVHQLHRHLPVPGGLLLCGA